MALANYLYARLPKDGCRPHRNGSSASQVPDTVALVRAYFAGRGRQAAEKYFWKNALAAYKWTKRAPDQPSDQP
ncbi:MAG: hypothetical protein H6924_11045 [Alphaproteobacteria bacterium]|nr:hypothetical protein [Alphaproteobacteria bacterium]